MKYSVVLLYGKKYSINTAVCGNSESNWEWRTEENVSMLNDETEELTFASLVFWMLMLMLMLLLLLLPFSTHNDPSVQIYEWNESFFASFLWFYTNTHTDIYGKTCLMINLLCVCVCVYDVPGHLLYDRYTSGYTQEDSWKRRKKNSKNNLKKAVMS